MKQGTGVPNSNFGKIIGIATKSKMPVGLRHKHIYVGDKAGFHSLGFAGCVLTDKGNGIFQPGSITQSDTSQINDGDILLLKDDGTYHHVWQKNSPHNSFMLTEKCNCSCLMCPQPSDDLDKYAYEDAKKILSLLHGNKLTIFA